MPYSFNLLTFILLYSLQVAVHALLKAKKCLARERKLIVICINPYTNAMVVVSSAICSALPVS